jgi:fatty acid desaturase
MNGFRSTHSKHHAQANIQTTIKATKNSTPHERKQRTKRELSTTVTRTQETSITELSLKRKKNYQNIYVIKGTTILANKVIEK